MCVVFPAGLRHFPLICWERESGNLPPYTTRIGPTELCLPRLKILIFVQQPSLPRTFFFCWVRFASVFFFFFLMLVFLPHSFWSLSRDHVYTTECRRVDVKTAATAATTTPTATTITATITTTTIATTISTEATITIAIASSTTAVVYRYTAVYSGHFCRSVNLLTTKMHWYLAAPRMDTVLTLNDADRCLSFSHSAPTTGSNSNAFPVL